MTIYNVSGWRFSKGSSMCSCKHRIINMPNDTLESYTSSEEHKLKNGISFMRRRPKFLVFSGVFLIFIVVFGLQPMRNQSALIESENRLLCLFVPTR